MTIVQPNAQSRLPRLAYVGDVAVGDIGNGPKLLKCLLENYPSNNLRLLISDFWDWIPATDPAAMVSETFPMRWQRFRFGRLYELMSTHCLLASHRKARDLQQRLEAFRPEGILTVTAGPGWLTAARLAKILEIPLHLILHDHLPTQCAVLPMFRCWLHRRFADVYRQAQSRLCVSPNMEEFYRDAFGVGGTVLYPSRSGNETAKRVAPAPRVDKPFTVAYAGTLAPRPYVEMLLSLATQLGIVDGRLLVYALTCPSGDVLRQFAAAKIEIRTRLSTSDLQRSLSREADVLFAPMSFATADEINMRISFPSKLAEYTATGLPLLIWGPSYSSAVRWASEFWRSAMVVDVLDEAVLLKAIIKLKQDSHYRGQLAEGALAAGDRCFSAEAAAKVFHLALRT